MDCRTGGPQKCVCVCLHCLGAHCTVSLSLSLILTLHAVSFLQKAVFAAAAAFRPYSSSQPSLAYHHQQQQQHLAQSNNRLSTSRLIYIGYQTAQHCVCVDNNTLA